MSNLPPVLHREVYTAAWEMQEYRQKCHSLDLWHSHREIFPLKFNSALDIGCGLGLLLWEWYFAGKDAWGVDWTYNCLDTHVKQFYGHKFKQQCLWEMDMGRRFDLGICTDVMEHIPEDKVDAVLERIRSHCDTVIFKIANFPSQVLGYNLHPTRKPADWWLERIRAAGGKAEQLFIPTDRKEYFFRWNTK